jgi:PAS domain S-box-containing protein
MREFFLEQMDYVFFMYGLAFLLLFSVCISLQKRSKTNIPWNLFGLFGLVHGIHEWLELSALSLGDGEFFKWVRLVLMAVSFICLLEFGRLTCERLKSVKVGRWIYFPLLLAILSEIPAGMSGLNAAIRYGLGLTGGLWAAFALWLISKKSQDGARAVALAAAAMAVYAVASGFIVPHAGLLFAATVNHDSFLKAAGFPIQLLRSMAACVIAMLIWSYHEELRARKADPRSIRFEKNLAAGVAAALLLVLTLGWFWTSQAGQRENTSQRVQLLNVSQQVVTTIDPELVSGLDGSAADLQDPAYQVLKARLQHLHRAITSVRFLYLMRKNEEKIILLADSEPSGSEDESPPGQIYDEATAKLRAIFDTGKGIVDDPMTDRWGSWISAYAPLNDGRTGKLIAVLGVDQNAHDFSRAVALARFKAIIFIGFICLSVLLVFIYWQRFSEAFRQNEENKKKDLMLRWGIAAIVALVGAILTMSLFLELRRSSWDSFQTTFMQRAISRAQSVSQELERQLDRLDGLRRFLDSQDFVERNEFSQYAAPLLKGVPIRALEWIPRVGREERLFCESSAKQDGLDGFHISEKDAQGKRIPVLERKEYFPVYYLEPLKGNEAAMGFDLASDPIRRAAMEKSCETGRPVATPPLALVQEGQQRPGVLVFMPVFPKDLPRHTVEQRRKSLKGFVLAVYNADEFLKGIYSKMPPEGLACVIEDLAAPEDNRVLYRHVVRDGTVNWGRPLRKYEMPLEMPDRQWRVAIVPSAAFTKRYLSQAYWWILPFGFFLTALVTAFLNFLSTARYRAERLVKLRTEELNLEKESLGKSENRFRQITESSEEFIWETDLRGLYTYASPMAEKMYGYKPAELVGKKHFHDFFCSEDRERLIKEIFDGFSRKEVFRNHPNVIVHRNGTIVFLATNAMPMVDLSGKLLGYRGLDRDVTASKAAEDALRKREAYLSSILDNFPYMVWLKDSGGRFLAVNKIFAKACGRESVEDVAGKNDFDIWPPEMAERYRVDDEGVMRGRSKTIVVEPIVQQGVTGYFETYKSPIFDQEGRVIGTAGFAHDITDRKSAEDALRASEERYRKITSSVTDYIYTVYIEKGKIVNTIHGPGCIGVTGYSAEEFRSQDMLWISMVPEEDKPMVLEQVRLAFSGKEPSPIEHRIIKKDGSVRWVISRIILRFNKAGDLVAYEGVIADITERKQAEALLLESRKQAEAANKAKSQFLANMSHEIRTPMNAVIGFSELLENTTLNRAQKDYVGTIRESSQMLMFLISDILDVSKIEAGELKLEEIDFDLSHLLKSVIKMNSTRLVKKQVEMFCSMDEAIPQSYKGDPTRIRQILTNLISNAIKFTEKGEISISVKAKEKPSGSSGQRWVLEFSVKDSGIGIPEDKHERIFEAFEQADTSTTRKYGGTGLGLTISKTLVGMMGGKIWVKSAPGQGSEFFFTLSLEEAPPVAQARIMPLKITDLKGKKVLIVDDNENASRMFDSYCRDAGMNVLFLAASAREALDWLAGQTELPEIILSDVMMPGMDGYTMAREIKKNPKTRGIKIVAVTSDVNLGAARGAGEAGFDAFLPKPVLKSDLIEIMRTVLGDQRQDPGAEQIVTRHMAEEFSCKGLKILVAEDNLVNQKLLRVLLKNLGCEVDVASNGQVAVEKVRTHRYDLVLMDIQMPGMGGLEATEIIRSQISKTLPILALTAAILKEDERKSLAAGMNDFIPKPVELVRLKEKIIRWSHLKL